MVGDLRAVGWLLLIGTGLGCTTPNPSYQPGSLPDTGQRPPDAWRPPPDGGSDAVRPPPDATPDRGELPDSAPSKPVGIDLLFVVDNSPGMATAQQRLARDIDSLLSRFDQMPGGPNYRIGVVTSDMGVGPFVNEACSAQGDAGKLHLAPDCPATADGKPYVERVADTANVADIDQMVSCLVRAGDEGCGFEQPLEAMRAAIVGGATGGFIRPGAALVVVILANEDDCSAADQSLYDPYAESFGPYSSYRCFQFGALCGGQQPPSHPDLLISCMPGQTFLHPVKARYVDPLLALKPPGWVAVLSLSGPTDKPIEVVEAETYQGAYWRLSPSCASGAISADPGLRLRSWTAGFGARGGVESLCSSSYREALVHLVTRIRPMF